MRQNFRCRITPTEEEVNCFSSYIEAMTVYNDRLSRTDSPYEMELIEVLAHQQESSHVHRSTHTPDHQKRPTSRRPPTSGAAPSPGASSHDQPRHPLRQPMHARDRAGHVTVRCGGKKSRLDDSLTHSLKKETTP